MCFHNNKQIMNRLMIDAYDAGKKQIKLTFLFKNNRISHKSMRNVINKTIIKMSFLR